MTPLLYFRIGLIAAGLIASFLFGVQIEKGRWDAEKVEIQKEAIAHSNRVSLDQGVISQQSQKDKDELQKRYDSLVAIYRNNSLQYTSSNTNSNTTNPVRGEGLRLSWGDAEVLVEFARNCSQSEIERNEVIAKYGALQ